MTPSIATFVMQGHCFTQQRRVYTASFVLAVEVFRKTGTLLARVQARNSDFDANISFD